MRALAPLLLAASLSFGGTALAGGKTAADISARCGEFTRAADKKTCKIAAKEVAKLAKDKVSGDVELFLESIEDQNGQLVLSRKRAKHMRTWAAIQRAEKEDLVLEGKRSDGERSDSKGTAKQQKAGAR